MEWTGLEWSGKKEEREGSESEVYKLLDVGENKGKVEEREK